jgi:hypothetical protein
MGPVLDAVHSMDRMRARIHRVTPRAGLQLRSAAGRVSMQSNRWIGCGPGCSCDPLRAVLPFGSGGLFRSNQEPVRKRSEILRTKCGTETTTHPEPGCRCDPLRAGTSCNIPPPVSQSRYIVQRVPGRVAVVIHCGPDCICDPRGQVARTKHAPNTHQTRTPSRVAVAIRCGPCCRLDPGVCFDQTKNPSANVPRFCGQNAEQRRVE